MRAALAGALAVVACATTPPPAPPLEGREWVVEDIGGAGVIDRVRATATFADGQVTGSTSCNRYRGPYSIKAGVMTIGPLAGTLRACPEAVMAQEARFNRAFRGERPFSFTADGALVVGEGVQALRLRAEPVG